MSFFKRLFGGMGMSWPRVLLFAIIVGVFCGVFGGLPVLQDTSFTDMAGGYEWWVIFALIVVSNCHKFWDAGLKCFVFFLITQPLMFYTQAVLFTQNYDFAYSSFLLWLPVIAATLPGGMIAYCAKKQNVFGAIILGIGNAIQFLMGVSYAVHFVQNPPYHIVACLVSFASIFIMTYALQGKESRRVVTFATALALGCGVLAYAIANGLSL